MLEIAFVMQRNYDSINIYVHVGVHTWCTCTCTYTLKHVFLGHNADVNWTRLGNGSFTTTDNNGLITIHKLQVGKSFKFRVAGVNKAGMGPFSESSHVIHIKEPIKSLPGIYEELIIWFNFWVNFWFKLVKFFARASGAKWGKSTYFRFAAVRRGQNKV